MNIKDTLISLVGVVSIIGVLGFALFQQDRWMTKSQNQAYERGFKEGLGCFEKIPVDPTNEVLQASVRLRIDDRGTGSGVLLQRGGRSWVLTAGHCVASADGTPYEKIEVSKAVYQGDKIIGRTSYEGKVVEYSTREDLALIMLDGLVPGDTHFAPPDVPPLGTPLMHVGNLLGDLERSFVTGILAGYDRGAADFSPVMWQTTVGAWPGSSGGGVYTLDGNYLGMLTQGAGPTLNFIIPVTRIFEWAVVNDLEWLFLEFKTPNLLKYTTNPVGTNIVVSSEYSLWSN